MGYNKLCESRRKVLFLFINVAFASLKAVAKIIGLGSPCDLVMWTLKLLANFVRKSRKSYPEYWLASGMRCRPKVSNTIFQHSVLRGPPFPTFLERRKFPRRRGLLYSTVSMPDFIVQHLKGYKVS